MQTIIHSQGFSVTDPIKAHLSRRLSLAIGQFDRNITKVNVFLKDINGAGKGGEDKNVLVEIHLRAQAPLVVEETSNDLYMAISIAARKARRALKRTMHRLRRFDRGEPLHLRLTGPAGLAESD